MGTKSLVLDGAEIVRSANFVSIEKIAKKFKKNKKFDLQGYFNMKMMFNGLDRSSEFLNSIYGREARDVLFFAKHHNLTIYIELGYGALQNTRALCALRSIINFKLEMIDPNRSI
jgi:hypothetical protein